MTKSGRTYSNSGAQALQAAYEVRKWGSLGDDDFVTLKTVAIMLGINRNKVCKIPIEATLIDKRKAYRKGDIRKWLELDARLPNSLLQQLRSEQLQAAERKQKHPSRR